MVGKVLNMEKIIMQN